MDFSGIPLENNNSVDVLKDLQNPENIDIKTELSLQQMKILNQLNYLIYRFKNKEEPLESFSTVINELKTQLVSKNRKGRLEITDAVKKMPIQEPTQPLINQK